MKPRDLFRFVVGGRQETCEACQQPFPCGSLLQGCWCLEMKLSAETRQRLRTEYHHCLCRACLEKAEAEREGMEESGRAPTL